MPITLNGDTGITTPTYGGTDTSEYLVPVTAFKNRIINGAMMIDQRNAGASVSVTGTLAYYLDRYLLGTQTANGTAQRSTVAPAGFVNSILFTAGTGASPSAAQFNTLSQRIEGNNIADLGWGTANAQTVTVSFWARSSLTGTFAFRIGNGTITYVSTYTISSANTWEYKTITISGPTSGTWATNNTVGMYLNWDLGSGSNFNTTDGSWNTGDFLRTSGSVNIIGTSGATFYITGVQLEKGSTATSFDYRPYGTELDLCRRYFQLSGGAGRSVASATIEVLSTFNPPMRAAPSSPTIINGTGNAVQYGRPNTNINSVSAIFITTAQGTGVSVVTADTGLSTGAAAFINPIALGFSAEL